MIAELRLYKKKKKGKKSSAIRRGLRWGYGGLGLVWQNWNISVIYHGLKGLSVCKPCLHLVQIISQQALTPPHP